MTRHFSVTKLTRPNALALLCDLANMLQLQGFFDALLPGLFVLWVIGRIWKNDNTRPTAHIAFAGAYRRLLVVLTIPFLPLKYLLARWDWHVFTCIVFESLAHFFHFKDTTPGFRLHLYGHHAMCLVWWLMAAYLEVVPVQVSFVYLVAVYEASSLFSDVWYLAASQKPPLKALIVASFWCQRVSRWTVLLYGCRFIPSIYASFHHPSLGWVVPFMIITLPAICFELYCITCQWKLLHVASVAFQ